MTRLFEVLCRCFGLVGLFWFGNAVLAADPLPYGHPDFYPSPQRPAGYRGDGNGYFPGATIVSNFWEGTLKEVEQSYTEIREGQPQGTKSGKAWDYADDKKRNVIWKTKMPAWVNSQPLVVGDLVFTTAEPDRLVCVDARTGKILWSDRANVWAIATSNGPAAEAAHRLFDIGNDAIPGWGGMTGGGTMGRLVMPDEFKGFSEPYITKGIPRIVAALAAADPETDWKSIGEKHAAGVAEYVRLLSEREAAGTLDRRKGLDNNKPRDMNILKDTLNRRIQAICRVKTSDSKQGVPLDAPWGNLVGFACTAPISDGERVYASFGQGQTVCYTVDGKRLWAVYREQERHGSRMSHAQSLRLADGVLVDTHGGSQTLAGLDAKTGNLVWETPTLGAGEFGKKGGYYVANHAVMPLKNGDKVEHVLITSRNNIIRIRDGKSLGSLPFEHGTSGGPSLSCSGDIVYRVICGDNTTSPLAAFRLSLAGDTVKAEKLWETPKDVSVGYQARVALPGHYLMPHRDGAVFEAETGKVTGTGVKTGVGGLSDLVIGSTWIWLNEKSNGDRLHSSWGYRRWDGKALALFAAADVADPANPKKLSTQMIIGDGEFANVPVMQELTPELYALPNYGYNSWGKPMHSVHADVCFYPHGKFLFIRTVASLYCIGDPSTPWHTPAGAPKVARTGP
jgi:outer membrane protein assembly factor BamB